MKYRGIDIEIKESLFFKTKYIVDLDKIYTYYSPEETRIWINDTLKRIEKENDNNTYRMPEDLEYVIFNTVEIMVIDIDWKHCLYNKLR